ncbi:hypothetical protein BEWA_017970 [Theileria equi strain WA]|uniref:Uncharacterized protein n=1 Tax=Theileria equi strain WA TaxID=1537102 RepID=L0AVC0_THEEQ|nr:hypothetical protein BEWA_017970 [Theileria equi strain WA]AFZ78956.1 hypothetical protein BEWA_017970 [Theileria equi strain WA]|eukprot:XP_004828622.1 hypothetical protein BEWA_017970 [Theileria equi strain WA]
MPISLKSGATVFISVRRGLESHLLKEIKRNIFLNKINRIHHKRTPIETVDDQDLRILSKDQDFEFNTEILNKHALKEKGRWICKFNNEKAQESSESRHSVTTKDRITKFTERKSDLCDINVQSGGLEIKCTFEWLIKSILFIKSAESIWLRIGHPFRSNNEEQLTRFISELPWNLHISADSLSSVPLRIISRNSTLWSSYVISRCVRSGLNLSFERYKDLPFSETKATSLDSSCISITLNRNTCYVAIQCSGRLSPRLFNFSTELINNLNSKSFENFIPYWSLSKLKTQLRSENGDFISSNSTKVLNTHIENKRERFIESQKLISNDHCDTTDSLYGAFLQNSDIYKAFNSKIHTIWDPFCGNGVLICEIISLLLSLPNFNQETFPNLRTLEHIHDYKSLITNYIDINSKFKVGINIVGSDTSHLKLVEANDKLTKFSYFYSRQLKSVIQSCRPSPFLEMQSLYGSYHKIPFVTLHHSSIEDISSHMRNTVILTKVPYTNLKGSNRLSAVRLYKKFGQIVGSRSDWVGVYAISRSHSFEYYTGLEWNTLAKCTNSKGDIIKLLKWSGKTRWFKTPEEKINQLNKFDF